MSTTHNIVRDGERVRVSRDGAIVHLDKDGHVIQDKQVLSVPLVLMDQATIVDDARLQRPGPRYNTDAAAADRREMAYGEYLAGLNDGWRSPDPAPIADDKKPVTDARESAHAAMVGDLGNAWRGGAQ